MISETTMTKMTRPNLANLSLAAACLAAPLLFAASSTLASELDGAALYAENCASCHGDNLEGQPDWRTQDANGVLPAPPHDKTGHTWHHGDRMLFLYTKFGGQALMEAQGLAFNSGMPPFREALTDDEITAILDFIKSSWPQKERQVQAQRTAAEQS